MAVTQRDTLPVYTALRLLRDSWAGKLVLATALDDGGCAITMACLAAGAAVLTIEPQPQRIKDAVHTGCCDFAVTTLDEALRILKNEIRQQRPVSVGLQGSSHDLLPALERRGVLTNLLLQQTEPSDESSRAFHDFLAKHGSASDVWSRTRAPQQGSRLGLQGLLQQQTAQVILVEVPATPALQRAQLSTAVADALVSEPRLAEIMQRWLQIAPRLFPRDRTVTVWQPTGL